jgi:hypothetical protein
MYKKQNCSSHYLFHETRLTARVLIVTNNIRGLETRTTSRTGVNVIMHSPEPRGAAGRLRATHICCNYDMLFVVRGWCHCATEQARGYLCLCNIFVNSEIFELVPLLHIKISVFCFKVS